MNGLLLFFQLLSVSPSDVETRLNWLIQNPLTGLPKYQSDHPPTAASAKLGRVLLYDKRISGDGTVSCASCHQVQASFSVTSAVAIGIGGATGKRKPPPILNKAFLAPFFWDGRAATLEEQAVGPLFDSKEMGSNATHVIQVLSGISGYAPLFHDAFGDSAITVDRVAVAISDFERTLMSGGSRWDKSQADPQTAALSEEEKHGFALFKDRDCEVCHAPPFFTDNLFHNTGVGFGNGLFSDNGRFGVTGTTEETGAFKTPTLRNLTSHAPYMHDGSVQSLEDLVEFYDKGGIRNPHLDRKIIPLGLKPDEKSALLAFLKTLDGTGYEDLPPSSNEMPQ